MVQIHEGLMLEKPALHSFCSENIWTSSTCLIQNFGIMNWPFWLLAADAESVISAAGSEINKYLNLADWTICIGKQHI